MGMEAFFRIHTGLPREAPGSDAATREALRRLGSLPEKPRVLDLGCGPGRSSLVLAAETGGTVYAVDVVVQYLERLQHEATARGLTDRIITLDLDFTKPEKLPRDIDLLWSEGAIYHVGFEAGLRAWRPVLAPGAAVALTELVWLTDDPPPEAKAFWAEGYPAMTDVATNVRFAEAAGYRVVDTFVLPPSAWWDEYYGPLRARVAALRDEARTDPALAHAIEATEREIAIHERHGASYGYAFFLLRRE